MAEPLQPPAQFPFPFPPYDIQEQLMTRVFNALEGGKLAILESPTGTGKSLSLICGALSWLHEFNKQQKCRLQQDLETAERAVQQCEAADDWFSEATARQQQTDQLHTLRHKLARLEVEEGRVAKIKLRRKKLEQQQQPDQPEDAGVGVDQLYRDMAIVRDTAKRELTAGSAEDLSPEEQELLLGDDEDGSSGDTDRQEEEEDQGLKIYYCSRTHSQLSQFVGELQKTVYGGTVTRVVALAARNILCINPEVARLSSPALVNDRCLELQKKRAGKNTSCQASSDGNTKGSKRSKTSHGCPYNGTSAVRGLADQLLSTVQDLEELVKQGKQSRACPYYAARTAIRDAQLVVVPYNSVLQASTRQACGITLRNNALIVDEAHNLLGTLAAVQEITLTYGQVCGSRGQLQQYLHRYQSRLSPRNVLYCNQILFCLKAFLAAMAPTPVPSSGHHTTAAPAVPDGELVSVASFLSSCRVDNINLTKLLAYLDTSHLPQKLHGFSQMFRGTITTSAPKSAQQNTDKTSTASFLSRLSTGDHHTGKENTSPAADGDATDGEASQASEGSGNTFLQVVELLRRLVSSNSSGRMLLHRDPILKKSHLKYVVLDPAAQFHDIVRDCRAVILCGGTMKPLDEFRSQLFLSAGAPASRLLEFCCGHVVPPDNILPIALSAGPTGRTLDLTHSSRSQPEMVREVGRVLLNLSAVVPAGVVVFLPSYQYAQYLLDLLRKEGIVDRIQARKKVLEEPRAASAVAAVLSDYAATIRRGSGTRAGAMLFCVVGGKMSEGINFSDDLGRCVVMIGLPYPNSQSPELRERMKHLNSTQTSSNKERSPGEAYYHNLCFRAVNQSIGRAIRHKGDYACIVLVDQRYCRPATIASLPDWIAKRVVASSKFGAAQGAIAKFFARHKQRILEEKQQL